MGLQILTMPAGAMKQLVETNAKLDKLHMNVYRHVVSPEGCSGYTKSNKERDVTHVILSQDISWMGRAADA